MRTWLCCSSLLWWDSSSFQDKEKTFLFLWRVSWRQRGAGGWGGGGWCFQMPSVWMLDVRRNAVGSSDGGNEVVFLSNRWHGGCRQNGGAARERGRKSGRIPKMALACLGLGCTPVQSKGTICNISMYFNLLISLLHVCFCVKCEVFSVVNQSTTVAPSSRFSSLQAQVGLARSDACPWSRLRCSWTGFQEEVVCFRIRGVSSLRFADEVVLLASSAMTFSVHPCSRFTSVWSRWDGNAFKARSTQEYRRFPHEHGLFQEMI